MMIKENIAGSTVSVCVECVCVCVLLLLLWLSFIMLPLFVEIVLIFELLSWANNAQSARWR